MSQNKILEPKEAFKQIGIIFSIMFGILFTIIYIFSIIDNIWYTIAYKYYDGTIIEVKPVESYISKTTRYQNSTSGTKHKTTSTTTKYKQDIIVEYNDIETRIDDVSVDKKGYNINEFVPIYVSRFNDNHVKVHANISNRLYLLKFFIFVGGYWFLLYKLIFKKHKRRNIE